jgi:thiol-disulfide isomerase/thioredoxin
MRPVVSALEKKYEEENIQFITADVNTSDGLLLVQKYRVTATPTYILLDSSGVVKDTLLGRQEQADMEILLDDLLAEE